MDTDTLIRDETVIRTSNEGPKASHIVMRPRGSRAKSTQAYVLMARVEGTSVRALCGYEFIPQQNPSPLPVCQTCLEIYKNDPNGLGDRDELPDA